jgi:1-aminocyclopropane-1-carboxylate deaminase
MPSIDINLYISFVMSTMNIENFIPTNTISLDTVAYNNTVLHILRLDKIHSIVSGNKFFKLKYNLEEALKKNHKQILTFGGAFSNHIAATAKAAQLMGLQSVGVIRGEEINNSTLAFAQEQGMYLHFVDRASYRNKTDDNFLKELAKQFGSFYSIPEGGTNALAIRGTAEITDFISQEYDKIACCVGTGGTMSGLIKKAKSNQQILGFSALKGDWINDEIKQWVNKTNWSINTDYHFGGYAKWKPELISFINNFYSQTAIPLDPIYTGKMLYGVVDLINKGEISAENLLIIHSGGLQGIEGFNQRFGNIIET